METTPFLDRVDHVQLPVRDLGQSIEWYTQILGLTLWGGPGEDLCAFLALPEGPLVALWQTDDKTQSQFLYRGAPKPSLFFKTAQMKMVCERLQAAGARIGQRPDRWEYQENEMMKFLFFYDLNENYLGLIELRAGP